MKNRLGVAFLLLISAIFVTTPLFAHHSSSSYDMEHPVNMKGVVSNVEWTNPHVFIFLDVKDDNGSVEEWRVEGNSPKTLFRVGWKKEMIKAGDQLVVNGALAKNGSKIMRLISITLATVKSTTGKDSSSLNRDVNRGRVQSAETIHRLRVRGGSCFATRYFRSDCAARGIGKTARCFRRA